METYGIRNNKVALVVDSSGLIHTLSRKIDLKFWLDSLFDSPYELCLTRPVQEELKRLSTAPLGKIKLLASLSLKLLENCRILETEAQKADDSIVEAAIKYGCFVLTCDSALKHRIKAHGLITLTVTNDNRLTFS